MILSRTLRKTTEVDDGPWSFLALTANTEQTSSRPMVRGSPLCCGQDVECPQLTPLFLFQRTSLFGKSQSVLPFDNNSKYNGKVFLLSSFFSHQVTSNSCNPMDCSPPGSSVHGTLQASNFLSLLNLYHASDGSSKS